MRFFLCVKKQVCQDIVMNLDTYVNVTEAGLFITGNDEWTSGFTIDKITKVLSLQCRDVLPLKVACELSIS